MKNVIAIYLLGCFLLLLGGCAQPIEGDERTAEQYVKEHGYDIVSRKGKIHTYTLDKSKLYGSTESTPYQQSWSVQSVAPDPYFGSVIDIYRFVVSSHPLEKQYDSNVNVYIMISKGNVIGGYSFPNVDGLAGSAYSLDGKTLEEITGMTFAEWSKEWKKKYGE
ncbi:hypothetical protein [Paenibacillus turpanensis]|uniref:hypothetical protein n=1 Tax=Paenibacillus turpanensis TaxID=2689078 RepID=UPI001407C132|nr:hypothetical protein [Paenibacillus turpanensis]